MDIYGSFPAYIHQVRNLRFLLENHMGDAWFYMSFPQDHIQDIGQ